MPTTYRHGRIAAGPVGPPAVRRQLLPSGERTIAVLAVAAVATLVAGPLLMLIFSALRGPAGYLPFQGEAVFTTQNFIDALTQRNFPRLARDTTLYVGGATAVGFVIGTALAFLVERTRIPLRNVIFLATVVPLLLPPRAILGSWTDLTLPRTGTLNVLLRSIFPFDTPGPINLFNLPSIIVIQGLLLTPLVFLLMTATLRNMNSALEEASRTSGAGVWTTLRRVTLPIAFPGAFTTVVLSVWLTLDSTDVPFTFGSGRISLINTRLFDAINGVGFGIPHFGLAAAYAMLTMAALILLFWFYARSTRQAGRYATVTGTGARARRFDLGVWTAPALALVLLYLTLMWGLPGYDLIRGSLADGLNAYGAVLSSGRFWDAVRNTAIMAVGSATLGTLIVVLVAWTVVRSHAGRWKAGLDLLATSSLVVPAIMAGVAFLLIYLSIEFLPLYQSILGVILALTFRLAIPYRISNASMRQIGRDMEEVSATSGAAPFKTLTRITLPILAPAMTVSWLIFFLFAIRETTLLRMLSFYGPTLSSVRTLVRTPGGGAAGTVVMIVLVLTVVVAVRYVILRSAKLRI